MRTIAADWSVSNTGPAKILNWLSGMSTRLRRMVSAQPGPAISGGRGSDDLYLQADVAAFISNFMRIG